MTETKKLRELLGPQTLAELGAEIELSKECARRWAGWCPVTKNLVLAQLSGGQVEWIGCQYVEDEDAARAALDDVSEQLGPVWEMSDVRH